MFKRCPYCNTYILTISIKKIPATDEWWTKWSWVVYTCSNFNCNAILSVWIDPIAIKSDIVSEVIWELKKLKF